jgi:hypothetical protein
LPAAVTVGVAENAAPARLTMKRFSPSAMALKLTASGSTDVFNAAASFAAMAAEVSTATS